MAAHPGHWSEWAFDVTEVELVMSFEMSCGSGGQAGLGEAAVYEVGAVLDVPEVESDVLDEDDRAAELLGGRRSAGPGNRARRSTCARRAGRRPCGVKFPRDLGHLFLRGVGVS